MSFKQDKLIVNGLSVDTMYLTGEFKGINQLIKDNITNINGIKEFTSKTPFPINLDGYVIDLSIIVSIFHQPELSYAKYKISLQPDYDIFNNITINGIIDLTYEDGIKNYMIPLDCQNTYFINDEVISINEYFVEQLDKYLSNEKLINFNDYIDNTVKE